MTRKQMLGNITLTGMKKIIAFLAAAAMLPGLVSCGSDAYRTAQFTYADYVPLRVCDSLSFAIDQSFVYFKSVEAGRAVRDALNDEIVQLIFGETFTGVPLKEASSVYVGVQVENYQRDAASEYESLAESGDSDPGAFCNWQSILIGNLGSSYKDRYVTYNFHESLYFGGAHGSFRVAYRILDLQTGRAVSERDIFAQGYEEPVTEMLVEAIYRKYEGTEGGDDYLDSIFFSDVHPNGNVSISEEGLSWCFNPYEIAPYYLGNIDVTLSWAQLSGYLSNEFNFE